MLHFSVSLLYYYLVTVFKPEFCKLTIYHFSCHGLDGSKIYDKHLTPNENGSDVSYNTFKRMSKIITNFARTG